MGSKKRQKFVATTVATAVVASMAPTVVPTVQAAGNFNDVPTGAFYEEAVNALAQDGVIGGYEDGSFKPSKSVTRAEAAKIIAFALGLDANEVTPTFTDVKESNWFYQPVGALAQAGGIGGYEDGTFKPNNTITRAEMASMLVKAYGLTADGDIDLPFTDVSASSWYVSAVKVLYANNVTSGKSATSFAPNDVVTRGEMAAFVHRAGKVSAPTDVIESVTDAGVTIAGVTYTLTDNVKNILGAHNADVLTGATVEFEESNGQITNVTALQLNKSGSSSVSEFASNLVLDGKGGKIAGDLVVNADYISLKNVTVNGDLTISRKLANDFHAENVTVTGDTVVNGGDDNTVVFKDSRLQGVEVNKPDVRVEAQGTTTIKEIRVSSDATIVSNKTIETIIVEKEGIKLSLGSNTTVNNIELPVGVKLEDVVTSSSARKNIKNVNDSSNPEYSSSAGGGIVGPVDNGDDDDSGSSIRRYNGGTYDVLKITQDAIVKNVTVNHLILDPGNNGDVTLDNVVATKITVLSGAENSIHLNNTVVIEDLIVENDNTIRIVFGEGSAVNSVTLKTAVKLEATATDALINKVNVAAATTGDVISFTGAAFAKTDLNVTKGAKIETTAGTKMNKITVATTTGDSVSINAAATNLVITGSGNVDVESEVNNLVIAAVGVILNLLPNATISDALTILENAQINIENNDSVKDAKKEKAEGVEVTDKENKPVDQVQENKDINKNDYSAAITTFNAENGTISIALNKAPSNLNANNFKFKKSINNGTLADLPVALTTTADSITANFTFAPVVKTMSQQVVKIEATYDMPTGFADLIGRHTYVVAANKAPKVVGEIANKETTVGNPVTVSLSGLFEDPDKDTIKLSTDKGTINTAGTELTFTPTEVGTTTITVTAKDDFGGTVSYSFNVVTKEVVTENHAPVAKSGLNRDLNEDVPHLLFTAAELAEDIDGDTLSLVADSATSSNTSVATAQIVDGKLEIVPKDVASDTPTTIKVKVTDSKVTTPVEVSFVVNVKNVATSQVPAIKTFELDNGPTSAQKVVFITLDLPNPADQSKYRVFLGSGSQRVELPYNEEFQDFEGVVGIAVADQSLVTVELKPQMPVIKTFEVDNGPTSAQKVVFITLDLANLADQSKYKVFLGSGSQRVELPYNEEFQDFEGVVGIAVADQSLVQIEAK